MLKSIALATGFLVASTMGFADDKPVLGYVGQAEQKTSIFVAPNSHARRYSRVAEKQLLVVRPYSNVWDKVVMNTGAEGFVPASSIKVLPYEVTAKSPEQRRVDVPFEQGNLASRSGLAEYAMTYVGKVPYKFGGTSLNSGMDCSAFVREMYGKIGVNLPRTAAEQALVGEPIYRLELLQPGDRLYFWDAKRQMIGHTGIYKGNGEFVHNSHGKGGVAVSKLDKSWQSILIYARR
jgi:cell wall-associated NlpC family hydrolase